jgi:hypothetical protein
MVRRLGADHDIAGAEVRVEASSDPGEENVGRLELLDEQSSRYTCIHFPNPRVGEHDPPVFQASGREPNPLDGHFLLVREFLAQPLDFQGHRTEDGGDGRGASWPRGIAHLGDACCRE